MNYSRILKKIFHYICFPTGIMYLSNRLYDHFSEENPAFSAEDGDYFNWKGIKIYYTCTGSGDPLLLLHALHPAASTIEWNSILDKLSENHKVYALDLPGCGRSEKSHMHYTNFLYVKLINDFMQAMSINNIPVIASNLTSSVAVMTSAYNADLFTRIILISPPSISSLKEAPDTFCKIKKEIISLPIIGTFVYNILASKPQIDLAFTETYFYNPFHDNEELVDLYFASAHYGEGRGHYFAAYYLGKFINTDISHALFTSTIPIKIIEGAECRNAVQVKSEWTAVNGSVEIVEIRHTRQLPHLEEPEETSSEILSFLN